MKENGNANEDTTQKHELEKEESKPEAEQGAKKEAPADEPEKASSQSGGEKKFEPDPDQPLAKISEVKRLGIDVEEIDDENLYEIRKAVAEFEETLKEKYKRRSDKHIIKDERKQFVEKLIERELLDEARDIEDIRKEEHFNISINFILSVSILVIFTILTIVAGEQVRSISQKMFSFMITNFDWFYLLISSMFIIFLIYLAFSRFGHVVLGDPGERPEFSNFSWYAMLFSAGMGIGLLFWGGAEPLRHFLMPPTPTPDQASAARQALVLSSFHWGLHGWAVYTMTALGVAYYGFRKRKKYLLSSSVMDIFDNPGINKWLKIFSDLVATVAIVFGMGASIGMGIIQMSSGLKYVYGIDAFNAFGQISIGVLITVVFIISATTGLKKGIKLLSNVNMVVAIVLMIFVFLLGPKLFILKSMVDTTGQYLSNILSLGFNVSPLRPDYRSWMGEWTLTYFSWWIAWAPFVGIFVARISKGRTIRELIMGCLIVPVLFTVIWFSIFGGTAIFNEVNQTPGAVGHLVTGAIDEQKMAAALFGLLKPYPAYKIVSGIALLLMFTFLVTSADSATFVISMMTSEGDLDPPLHMKIIWGVIMSTLTLSLLLGGGLKAFKAVVLTFALPFAIVLILITISLYIRLSMQVKAKRI